MNTEIFRQDVNFVVLRQIELAFHSSLPCSAPLRTFILTTPVVVGERGEREERERELITDADEIIWN